MKINLEILNASFIDAKKQIEELNTKELVPKMMVRRRLTRSAKIAIYLASKIDMSNQRVVYGTAYGEPKATQTILNSIKNQEQISPTVFQNSVYNTAVSYLSMLTNNKSEIMTISSGDKTTKDLLNVGAIKALDGDEIVLMYIETLHIDEIDKLNSCGQNLEIGVALKIKISQEQATIHTNSCDIVNIAKRFDSNNKNIIEVNI